MRSFRFVVVGASLLIPASSAAAGFRPWVGINGSWATYSMSDVNNDIGEINTQLAGSGLWVGDLSAMRAEAAPVVRETRAVYRPRKRRAAR